MTEPDLFIEAKGRDGITVANMLHIIMASNEDWIVPAGEDERRYPVFTVSGDHMQDEQWFKPRSPPATPGTCSAPTSTRLSARRGCGHQMPTLAAPASAACRTVAPSRNAIAIAVDAVSTAAARSSP